jgi:hypothetical protein
MIIMCGCTKMRKFSVANMLTSDWGRRSTYGNREDLWKRGGKK